MRLLKLLYQPTSYLPIVSLFFPSNISISISCHAQILNSTQLISFIRRKTEGGAFFGALSGYPIGYYLGRKWGLFLASLIFTVGVILQLVSGHKSGLGIMYGGRVIVGWSVGVASNLTVSGTTTFLFFFSSF